MSSNNVNKSVASGIAAGASTWNWINEDYTLVTIPSSDHWVQREAADMVSNTMLWWLKSRP